MPKTLEQDTVRVHLQLYSEDWDYLNLVFDGTRGRKAGPVVRELIHQHVGVLRARAAQVADAKRQATPEGTKADV